MTDNGERTLKESPMADCFAPEVACRALDEAIRISGAYNCPMEDDVQRFYRDVDSFCSVAARR